MGVCKDDLGLVSGLFFFGRAFPGILNAQCGGDDGNLLEAASLMGFDDHLGEAGIQGELGHESAHGSQTISTVF